MENQEKYILAHSLIDRYAQNLEAGYKNTKQHKVKNDYAKIANHETLKTLTAGDLYAYLCVIQNEEIAIRIPKSYWENSHVKGLLDNTGKIFNIKVPLLYKLLGQELSDIEQFLIIPPSGPKPMFEINGIPYLKSAFYKENRNLLQISKSDMGQTWLKLNSFFRNNISANISAHFLLSDVKRLYDEENFLPINPLKKSIKVVTKELWLEIIRLIYEGQKNGNLKQGAVIEQLIEFMEDKATVLKNGKVTKEINVQNLVREIWQKLGIYEDYKENRKSLKSSEN